LSEKAAHGYITSFRVTERIEMDYKLRYNSRNIYRTIFNSQKKNISYVIPEGLNFKVYDFEIYVVTLHVSSVSLICFLLFFSAYDKELKVIYAYKVALNHYCRRDSL
jgi:hypothetical protein